MSEWISVDERLPDLGEEILTVDCYGDMETARFDKGMYGYISFFTTNGTVEPTHWMPLPKFP